MAYALTPPNISPMPPTVALIDDDPGLLELLDTYLATEGFSVLIASDGVAGTRLALSGQADIVVLDIMMPGQSGIETLRRIREASTIPVLMLTGRGDDLDRVLGLELGADDYVPKPCTPRELVARIRAILKRTRPVESSPTTLRVGELVMKPGERRAELDGKLISLTSTEYSLLEILVRHAGQVVSKEHLSEEALGRPLGRFDRSIDTHISSVRRKLGAYRDGKTRIETVIRRGYQYLES
jgi:two-component system OmpR family response regulator